jgi:hypothetical protein
VAFHFVRWHTANTMGPDTAAGAPGGKALALDTAGEETTQQ